MPAINFFLFDVSRLDLSIDVWYGIKNIVPELLGSRKPSKYRWYLMCQLPIHYTRCASDNNCLIWCILIRSINWCIVWCEKYHFSDSGIFKTKYTEIIYDRSYTYLHCNMCQWWDVYHWMDLYRVSLLMCNLLWSTIFFKLKKFENKKH